MSNQRTPTILLIDNDESLLAAMTTRFEHMGYHCITAQTGAQGIGEFQSGNIDLVITDMNMPTLDGMGVIKKIREHAETPIIVVTGFKQAYAHELRDCPNIQIMEKPFHNQALIDAAETELYLHQAKAA